MTNTRCPVARSGRHKFEYGECVYCGYELKHEQAQNQRPPEAKDEE